MHESDQGTVTGPDLAGTGDGAPAPLSGVSREAVREGYAIRLVALATGLGDAVGRLQTFYADAGAFRGDGVINRAATGADAAEHLVTAARVELLKAAALVREGIGGDDDD